MKVHDPVLAFMCQTTAQGHHVTKEDFCKEKEITLQDLNYRDITPMNSWGSLATAWSNQLSPPEISREINSTFSEVNQNRGRKPKDLFLISHDQDPRTTFKYYPSISHGPRKQIRKRYQ